MVNPQKDKGDRFERLALALWVERVPELLVARPERELGAGRAEDKGDLKVLPDCAIQVKAHNDTIRAVTQAAAGADRQKSHREVPLGVGMVPVMRARTSSVKWLMCAQEWPAHPDPGSYLVTGLTGRAVERVRDDSCGISREQRLAVVVRAGNPDVWVGTFEAWVAAYRRANQATLSV